VALGDAEPYNGRTQVSSGASATLNSPLLARYCEGWNLQQRMEAPGQASKLGLLIFLKLSIAIDTKILNNIII